MGLRDLNLIFKMVMAVILLGFSLIYPSVLYNTLLIAVLIILLTVQRIRIFRYRSLLLSFVVFLCFIFVFRMFTGYGRVYMELVAGLRITSGGLHDALYTVEQIVLVFLLAGTVLYSTQKEELVYYLQQMGNRFGRLGEVLQQFLRIGMFALYLIPEMFHRARQVKKEMGQPEQQYTSRRHLWKNMVESIGQFIVQVLRQSENLYPEFLERISREDFRPVSVVTPAHLSYLTGVLIFLIAVRWMEAI